ncbi:hypothetical protein GCM10007386_28580 [Pseudoduganella dura]|nr:hypothetical protein GCM10007386_28580 [Pseudoduganella dura]
MGRNEIYSLSEFLSKFVVLNKKTVPGRHSPGTAGSIIGFVSRGLPTIDDKCSTDGKGSAFRAQPDHG